MTEDELPEIETIDLVPDLPPPVTGETSVPLPDPALSQDAHEADQALDGMLNEFQGHMTRIAQLIHRIRAQELYRALGYETFEAYIRSKELRLSRSFIYQLAKVGEVLENSGVGLEAPALAQPLQISKLAQIARLPDPETHRRVLETGNLVLRQDDGREEEIPLNDIPVKRLQAHINDTLGLPKRFANDPDPEPVERPRGQVAPGMQNAAAYQIYTPAGQPGDSPWQDMLQGLVNGLMGLEGSVREQAVATVIKAVQGVLRQDIPF
jgi:hypothetical protein